MTARLRTPSRSFLCLLALVSLAGCTTTQLEYDRMSGTTLPPEQTVDGEAVTLTSIYVKAGKLLVVNEGDTAIAALPGDSISNAELDSLETANRSSTVGVDERPCGLFNSSTCRDFHVYGIVVNHFGESSGAKDTGLLGRMWTTGNRRAFANFFSNTTVSGDGGKYLRSAAHEIGHAFNLHHEDGGGDDTIMNQTGVVGDTYVYEFNATSQNHLDNHPDACVFPGVGVFLSCVADHPNHVTQDCAE